MICSPDAKVSYAFTFLISSRSHNSGFCDSLADRRKRMTISNSAQVRFRDSFVYCEDAGCRMIFKHISRSRAQFRCTQLGHNSGAACFSSHSGIFSQPSIVFRKHLVLICCPSPLFLCSTSHLSALASGVQTDNCRSILRKGIPTFPNGRHQNLYGNLALWECSRIFHTFLSAANKFR